MSLRLKTLGRLDIIWEGQATSVLTLRKSQALLIYLSLNPGSHDRSHLAGLLWGELPEQNARRNLRHALHKVRHSLDPEILESDRLSAGLNPDFPIQVDALDFEAAFARAAHCQREQEFAATANHLERGVELYKGDFLDTFSLPDCAAFEEWAACRRAQLREQALQALDTLATYWTQRGTYERALRYARQLVTLEPLWEKSYRQLITLLILTGQRSAALAQYQTCRRVLKTELGLEPLEETTALYDRLVNWTSSPQGAPNTSSDDEGSSNLPFMGREEEHAALVRWWEAAQRGTNKLMLVEGEAGVGKTRLVEELFHYIEPQGMAVLRGRCYEFGGGVPYQPIAEALRGYVHARERISPISPVWLAELARLLPELRQHYPDLPEAGTTAGEAARQRLFEAVARFLRSGCDIGAGLCLFIDDLHWADPSTLDLLHYLVRHLEGMPLWLIGTYRPEEVSLRHPLTRLRQGLGRDHCVVRLRLRPLSSQAVQALAQSLVGEQQSAALGDFLYRESEGNPFILVETVSDLREQGALVTSDSGARHGDGEHLAWTGVPPTDILPLSVQDVILQRVGRLSEPAQRLLTLAAVVGQHFDAALLRTAGGRDADAVEESLDEWRTRHLIHAETSTAQHRDPKLHYDFSHDKIRAVVYHSTAPEKRRCLHHRVAEALEVRVSDQVEAYVGLLAYHWEQAGEPERATAYLLQAGDQARLVYAHQEATGYYRRALAILERQGEAGRERAAQILLRLGMAHHEAFDFQQARQAYEESFTLSQQAEQQAVSAGWSAPARIRTNPGTRTTLRLRWLEPTTLDPAMSPDNHTSTIITQLFSGLVALNPDMAIVPDIARAWEISEDGGQYLFHLRDDARWSDGVPVRAGDFEYTWKRTLNPATKSPAAGYLYPIKGAQAFHQGQGSREDVGVHALDETTLAVALEQPTSYFLQLLVSPDYHPVPRHVVEEYGERWADIQTLVSNGPFRIEDWQKGEAVILTRNADYHGRFEGNVQRVALNPIPGWEQRLQRSEEGALDVLGITFFPPAEREHARQRHASAYISKPTLETAYLVFDVCHPPFDDARIRRAFALATDRESLAHVTLQGCVSSARGGILPLGMPGHTPGIALPHTPEQARRLLAEAGYPGGEGFPRITALGFQAAATRCAALQAQWRDVLGIDVAWQTPDWTSFLKRLRGDPPPHMLYAMWVADYPDPDNLLRVCRAETWSNWQNGRYDSLVDKARRVMNQKERVDLYQQAEQIVVEEVPVLPLTYEREHLLVQPWVQRYPLAASKTVFWKDVVIAPR